MNNTRITLLSLAVVVGLLLVGCTRMPADPARPGDSCEAAPASYTCAESRAEVLHCNSSSLWQSEALCDDGCVYTDDEVYGAVPCCAVNGETNCYDDNGLVESGDENSDS